MGKIYMKPQGAGTASSDATASKADVLEGKKTVTSDSNDEIAEGTMPNNGAVNHELPVNGSYIIPKGYHNGSGKVTQSIPTQGGKTVTPTGSTQTVVPGGRYVTEDIKVAGVSGLPDVRPDTKQTFQEDNCKIYTDISNPMSSASRFICSYSKVKLNIKIAFKDQGFTDLGEFIVSRKEHSWSAGCNCYKFLKVRISNGEILENISGVTGPEMADARVGISFYKINNPYICLNVDVDNYENISGDFPYKAEITILEAWN